MKLIGPTSDFQGKGKYGLPIKANTGVADVEVNQTMPTSTCTYSLGFIPLLINTKEYMYTTCSMTGNHLSTSF